MLKNNDSNWNKTKVIKISIAVITIFWVLLSLFLGYHFKRQANIRSEEQWGKNRIMARIPLDEYRREENGYEEFLKDKNLPTVLLRLKEYMDTHYPSIGYGTKYKEITVEQLVNDYVEAAEELESMIDDLEPEYALFKDVMYRVQDSIHLDGIWIQRGTTKEEHDSAEVLMRKSKARCMDYLYIDRYVSAYTIWGYNAIHFEAFLADERLPIFLADMKEYMNTHYPEVGYGSQYEEITVERLKSDYETVYLELEEMIGKVEETGSSWNNIVWKIRNEADMSESRYDSKE